MNDNQFLSVCEPTSAHRPSQTNTPKRILVVDDDADICRLNAEVLSLCGYQVDAAEDGAAGWEKLQAKRYQLLITDNAMPKVSGVELLQQLWAARMALPVVMATGRPPEAQFKQSPWLAPDSILLKPYTIEQLIGTVRKALRAPNGDRQEFAPPPNWQSQPAAASPRP
jgi:DNA-binding response OmpR family regulator